jgi:hypothetical protein
MVQNYLYANETTGMVTHEFFNYSGKSYELLKIGGKESFLLKNGEMVRNATEISLAIDNYYKAKYAPSDSDMAQLRADIQGYNDSLNNGGRWKGKEEDSCRDLLLLDGIITKSNQKLYCISTGPTDQNCDYISQVFYYSAPYTEGVRMMMYYKDAAAALQSFAFSDNQIRLQMQNNFDLLNNLNDQNMKASLLAIKDSFTKIKTAEAAIENNIYRVPRANDKADMDSCKAQNNGYGCFGLCPDFDFDYTKLSDAESIINAITSKIDPYTNRQTIAASLAANTEKRIAFREGEDNAVIYSAQFAPLRKKGEATLAKADYVISYVNNATFVINVNKLKNVSTRINNSFTVRNFSTLDADMLIYANLERIVSNESEDVLQVYLDTEKAKMGISAMVFAVQSKGELSPDTKIKLDAAINESNAIDARFARRLTPQEYAVLTEQYGNVSASLSQILAGQQEFVALSKFRGMSRRVNNGIYDLAVSSQLMNQNDISTNAKYFPIGMAVFSWLSLSALVLFVFLAISAFVIKKKGILGATISGAGLVLMLGAVLLFSIALYFYLDKTSSNADVEEFIIGMNGKSNVSVVLDLRGVPPNTAMNMRTCASLLKDHLSSNNRTVAMFEITDGGCMKNGNALGGNATCGSGPETPEIILNYSTLNTAPTFSTIFENRANLKGDTAYYTTCQAAAVFQ